MSEVKSMVVGLMVCVCLLSNAGVASAFGTDKFKEELTKEKEAVTLMREAQQGGYGIVTTEELKAMIDAGKAMVIVDTMPYEDSYKKNHIPRAKQFLFPIPEMKEWNAQETGGKSQKDFEALLGPDKNKVIVMYCGFVKCTRSHNGATWAKKLGYTNVYRQPGGIFSWKGADYPVSAEQ